MMERDEIFGRQDGGAVREGSFAEQELIEETTQSLIGLNCVCVDIQRDVRVSE